MVALTEALGHNVGPPDPKRIKPKEKPKQFLTTRALYTRAERCQAIAKALKGYKLGVEHDDVEMLQVCLAHALQHMEILWELEEYFLFEPDGRMDIKALMAGNEHWEHL